MIIFLIILYIAGFISVAIYTARGIANECGEFLVKDLKFTITMGLTSWLGWIIIFAAKGGGDIVLFKKKRT